MPAFGFADIGAVSGSKDMRDPRSRSGADNADRPPPGQVDVGAANLLKPAGCPHCVRLSTGQQVATAWRSEERSDGKECVMTWHPMWSQQQKTQKHKIE